MFSNIQNFLKAGLLTILPFNVCAEEVNEPTIIGSKGHPIPECIDSRGNTVVHFKDTYRSVVSSGGLFAFATMHKDKPYTVYETEFLGQFPISFQEMAIAHECAHHRNGDLYKVFEEGAANIQIPVEDRADCDAIEYLVNDREYGEKEILEISNTWTSLIELAKQKSPSSVPFIQDKPNKIKACYTNLKR